MGRKPRLRPERLAEKLFQLRESLGLSQTEMLRRLGYEDYIHYSRISEYELGKNEPPYPILLQYARAAGISTDVLIDDELDLPDKMLSKSKARRK
ncbi:MAG TPA: helix-turn-helix transcriptional regulator [Pyrinomonadaceae bacterium]|nr:helix-turn-helix transcriptional regulator [Pyrinomonadaceae bacterium]